MKGSELLSLLSYVSFIWVFLLLHGDGDGVKGESYRVGDEEGWDTGINYHTWSTNYDLKVNDTLVFKYIKGEHNVYEVTEETCRSCNANSGVMAIYDSGNDEIKLNEAKEYWFICNIAGHCQGGMRFLVNLTSTSTPPADSPTPTPFHSSAFKVTLPLFISYLFGIFFFLLK